MKTVKKVAKKKKPATKAKEITSIKTFEDACKLLKLDSKKVIPDFSCYPKQDQASEIAHAKLVIIVRAVNMLANGGKEWKPNFDDANQLKYEIWFRKGSSGCRFDDCVGWIAGSGVGSRLCFISSEVAEETCKTFIDLYNEYLL